MVASSGPIANYDHVTCELFTYARRLVMKPVGAGLSVGIGPVGGGPVGAGPEGGGPEGGGPEGGGPLGRSPEGLGGGLPLGWAGRLS